jgi:hypothetical protein
MLGGAGDAGQVRQTKPNRGDLGYLGDRAPAGRAQGKCAKQTQFVRRGRGAGRGILYKQTQFAGTNCAKQTQFPEAGKRRQVLGGQGVMVNRTSDRPRQNKANSPIADWGQTCRLRPAQAIVQNKPNSQPHGTRGRSRQTKPIARSGAPRRCRGADRPGQRTRGASKVNLPPTGPIAPNKANFGESRIGAKVFAEADLCRVCPSHRVGKTKPIRAGRWRLRSVGALPSFVMLNGVKHLANGGANACCHAQPRSFADAQDDKWERTDTTKFGRTQAVGGPRGGPAPRGFPVANGPWIGFNDLRQPGRAWSSPMVPGVRSRAARPKEA